ncbi:MAG TPA: methyltransferase [Polyangiaceae bacterium]
MARKIALVDPVLGPLTDDLLTRDVRVYQRAKGHRFSSDDVATAYVAYQAAPQARRVLDLGCGLGSVLLQLAWKLPHAELLGVEAQPMSFALLGRNVARSGFAKRVRIVHADLREPFASSEPGERFELVTGTPPYFPTHAALDAEDEQRARARVEYRGGIEAYVEAGARLLDERGALVLCGDARADQRAQGSGLAAGLVVRERCDVVPRAGRPTLFSVWVLRREPGALRSWRLTLRDAAGEPTPDAAALRQFGGIPAYAPASAAPVPARG